PGRVVDHEESGYGWNDDLVARDDETNQLVVAAALQANVHCRALRAAQLSHRLLGSPPFGVLTSDPGDDVAAANAFLVRWGSLEDAHRHDVAVGRVLDRDAEAVVMPFLALAHLRVFLGAEKTRMRIEGAEHPAHGAVDQVFGIDLVD